VDRRFPVVIVVAALAVASFVGPQAQPAAGSGSLCPPGYTSFASFQAEEQAMFLNSHPEFRRLLSRSTALGPSSWACISDQRPEEFSAVATMQSERTARSGQVAPGAFRAALRQHDALVAAAPDVPGADGSWQPLGKGPLIVDDPRYTSVNGLGLSRNSGRIDSLDYDSANDRLFASIGTGGVWMSENLGKSWRSVGDKLPFQTNGAVAWSKARGGTLVVVSGEPLMGGNTYTGLGGFWSNDLGRSWHHSRGIPDNAMGFQITVDQKNPKVVYAATSKGLFRSTDAGRTYKNTKLPTGKKCAGRTGFGICMFRNFVTDVAVQTPGGVTNVKGGQVLAAVGYRAGRAEFPNGKIHSKRNGLYLSKNGKPGTFKRLVVSGDGASDLGFAPQQNIGRVELGPVTGAQQDHNYIYAIVQDAELFNGGVPAIDVPDDPGGDDQALYNTALNGIYVSPDFGLSWTRMADAAELAENPGTGSSLAGTGQAQLFAPGVQAWYNMWIKPDPTRQIEDSGIPTRLTFGLEEVWQNRNTAVAQDGTPQDPRGDFKVIGPYFADQTCLLLDNPLPVCPTSDPPMPSKTTTHPDQHDAVWVPDGKGGVSLVVGNDGGAYVQSVARDEELGPEGWGKGDNEGFHTLLPYDAEVAKDGTVWFGLQDNGSGKIDPKDDKHYETFGGDGFFVAVDPNNSDIAYSETTFADMRVTQDGGQTWTGIAPAIDGTKFSNPFVMDPLDAKHLMTAGTQVVERDQGPEGDWVEVFNLGNAESEGAPPNSMSALDLHGDAAYIGYCGICDILNQNPDTHPFLNGLATNVGGDQPSKKLTTQGWHIAKAEGLPNRYITSVAIDPEDPKTVYVALGGYANREWVPPGSYLDKNKRLGKGNVFMSSNAGDTFKNISANLPQATVNWVEVHGRQLVVGTDTGVYLSKNMNGGTWAPLAKGLPKTVVVTIRNHPGDPKSIVAATFGRGVYAYKFP